MKKILIATDGSAPAAEAVELGLELAEEHEAAVVFVHVARATDVVAMASYAFGAVAQAPHTPTDEDRLSLDAAAALAAQRGIAATTKLLHGDTVDEIVACADNENADLIIVGSRGHGVLTGAVLGSVSRGIVAESRRPVMVVRAETNKPVAA